MIARYSITERTQYDSRGIYDAKNDDFIWIDCNEALLPVIVDALNAHEAGEKQFVAPVTPIN
jgi:hypothetical protein